MNLSTSFRDLPFGVEMSPLRHQHATTKGMES